MRQRIAGNRRVLAALLVVVLIAGGAQLRASLGRQQDEVGPGGTSDLLSSPPFDRITLIDDTLMEVEPVSPRPLPVYDAKKDPGRRKRPVRKDEPKKENFLVDEKGQVTVLDVEAEVSVDDPAFEIAVKPLTEPNVFKIRRAAIKSLVYFEDMLLAEGDRLVAEKQYARAFEHFLAVKARVPNWPGIDPHVNRLLFAEGSEAISSNEVERGIRLLRELHARDRAHPGLSDALAKAYGGRVERAFAEEAYVEGRRELRDLETLVGQHPVTVSLRQRFVERASQHRATARGVEDRARKLDALTDAARVWPAIEGLRSEYEAAFRALPTLTVGVSDVPNSLGPWAESAAQERVVSLIYLPILAADEELAMRGQVEGQLAAGLEVADLGRKLVLNLREGSNWSDDGRPVTVADLVRTFTDAAYPGSPLFSARWSDLLDRVEISGPRSVSVFLRRPPLKPGYWFLRPAAPAHAGRDAKLLAADGSRVLVTNGLFVPEARPSDVEPLTLMAGEGTATSIRRVREVEPGDSARALRALAHGEIDLLEHVPVDQVGQVREMAGVQVGQYSLPRLHVVAIDGRVPVLQSRTLRRGLSYAIDRQTLLETVSGPRRADDGTAVLDGVAPKGSYADAPGVEALGFDPVLGRMLVAAARKELNAGPIQLTLDYPALPEVKVVVPKLVEAWKQVGVTVIANELPPSVFETRLRTGEPFELAYRVVTCDEPIVSLGTVICPGYDAAASTDALSSIASPLIVQLLLRLEQAPEFPTARGLAIEIDRRSRDELPVLPLWQLPDHYAWRANLSGPAEEAKRLYQGVEKWKIEPAYLVEP